ncbi:MAG: universal stress protein, partial [Alphaproteobacteria bacterium]|nr:universal stress protein [Alphaproteobacteria bacterium]
LQAAAQVQRLSGRVPSLAVREGDKVDETILACEEDPSVAFLILASDTGPKGPGPLISSLTGKSVGRLQVPVVILPGNLSEEEITRFA